MGEYVVIEIVDLKAAISGFVMDIAEHTYAQLAFYRSQHAS